MPATSPRLPIAAPVLRITVPLTHTSLSVIDVLGFGDALKNEALKSGGSGRVFRLSKLIQIDLQGVTRNQVDPWIATFGESLVKRGASIKIATVTATAVATNEIIVGEYLRQKLTRKLLFSLPDGAYVMSTVSTTTLHLEKHSDRERLWEHAVKERIAQCAVTVVWNDSDCALFRKMYPVGHHQDKHR